MTTFAADLAGVMELLDAASRPPWAVIKDKPNECLLAFGTDKLDAEVPGPWYSAWANINPDDGRALIAAANFLRTHGEKLQRAASAAAPDLLLAATECDQSAGVVRNNKFCAGVTAADHPGMEDRIAELGSAAEACRAIATVGPIPKADCYVAEMRTSAGTDYYVTIAVGDRRMTPHKYGERWKAEYDVACWNHTLNGAPKPNLLDYGP